VTATNPGPICHSISSTSARFFIRSRVRTVAIREVAALVKAASCHSISGSLFDTIYQAERRFSTTNVCVLRGCASDNIRLQMARLSRNVDSTNRLVSRIRHKPHNFLKVLPWKRRARIQPRMARFQRYRSSTHAARSKRATTAVKLFTRQPKGLTTIWQQRSASH
jgi:hypothetical protein